MAISWLNGVISVRDDLFGETFILFEVSQSSRVCMYCCRLAAAVWYCGCCVLTVRSSAYDIRCVFGSVGRGMSCMKWLKKIIINLIIIIKSRRSSNQFLLKWVFFKACHTLGVFYVTQ